jgi:dihydroneopterin aldolase
MELIFISELILKVHIGVTERERRKKQRIRISVEMEPARQDDPEDSIGNTVDYSAVKRGIQSLLSGETVQLIETVARRTARYVLDHYPVREVRVTVFKRPYKDVAHVGCRLNLSKGDSDVFSGAT